MRYSDAMDDGYASSLRENITKSYMLMGSLGALLIIPVVVPFLEQNGLALRQIFFLQALFGLTLMILEIPTGYLADHWGRKRTIVAGSLFLFLGILIYALSERFYGFLFAEFLIGVGVSFHSGTIEAFTYDTLLELGETDRYRSVHGHQDFIQFSMEGLASVVAGFIAVTGLRATAWATLVPLGIGCIIACTLTEPQRHKMHEKQHLRAIWRVCVQAFRDRRLRGVILVNGTLSTMALLLFWFTQPFEIRSAIPIALFGAVHATVCLAGAVAGKTTHAVSQRIGDRTLLILIAIVVILSSIALGFITAVWGLAFFILVRIAWGFLSPVTSDLINRMTSSDIRATVLSIQSFFFRFFFFLAAPLIGDIGDVHGISMGMFIIGIAGIIFVGLAFFSMRSVWAKIP